MMGRLMNRFVDYLFDEKRSDRVCIVTLTLIVVTLIARILVSVFFGV